MKHILVINNRDSFVYNIVEYLRECGAYISVINDNNKLIFSSIKWSEFDGIILSPGAGIPQEYPLMSELLTSKIGENIPILGICLGMQAMACASGAKLIQLPTPKHGHSSILIKNKSHCILENLIANTPIARYHSWVIDKESLPIDWEIIAYDEEDNIMIISHKSKAWVGTQFHPESIITVEGISMIKNWLMSL